MVKELLGGSITWFAPRILEDILLYGDFLAVAAAFIIIKNMQGKVISNLETAENGG